MLRLLDDQTPNPDQIFAPYDVLAIKQRFHFLKTVVSVFGRSRYFPFKLFSHGLTEVKKLVWGSEVVDVVQYFTRAKLKTEPMDIRGLSSSSSSSASC